LRVQGEERGFQIGDRRLERNVEITGDMRGRIFQLDELQKLVCIQQGYPRERALVWIRTKPGIA